MILQWKIAASDFVIPLFAALHESPDDERRPFVAQPITSHPRTPTGVFHRIERRRKIVILSALYR
jgi:hypothetical protein